MKYFLDTEFNGYKGELISVGLIRQDGLALYLVRDIGKFPLRQTLVPWVAENVIPVLDKIPSSLSIAYFNETSLSDQLYQFLIQDPDQQPVIVVDWLDDISYLCESLIVGPGQMVPLPTLSFELKRVDAYPSVLEEAVQHNALWDAIALRAKLTGELHWFKY